MAPCIEMKGVGNVVITCDGRICGRSQILIPHWRADQDKVVWINCADGLDDCCGIALDLWPSFIIRFIEDFIDHIGIVAILASHFLEEGDGICLMQWRIVIMPVDDDINAFGDGCVHNGAYILLLARRIV